MEIDPDLADQLTRLASTTDRPIKSMSMEQIAGQLGMTRMTLYRKAGSRTEILAALAARGVDVQREPAVRDRVIAATAELLRERPLAEVTLEVIAERASCSLPSIYSQLGGRQGVLRATFERYSPLPAVERLVASGELDADGDLRREARSLYGVIFDQVTDGWPVLRAFVAEVMRDPGSEVGRLFREWYLPRVVGVIAPTLQRHAARGSFRPLPTLLIAQAFVGPMVLHIASRGLLKESFGIDPPERDTTLDAMADMFCRAVEAHPNVDRS